MGVYILLMFSLYHLLHAHMSILFPVNNFFDSLFLDLAESIKDMVKLYKEFSVEYKDFEKFANRARIIEQQADDTTHKILNELQVAFITPYDREDLHALVIQLDDIVDDLESVLQWFYIYNISNKRPCIDEFADLYVEVADNLILLIKACFGKKKDDPINLSKIIIAIHTLEERGDELYLKNIRDLFVNEKDPIELMKWRVIIENMEDAMDRFEKTANTVESIKLKAN